LARIVSPSIFLEGTYVARVRFDNSPIQYQDGSIQTFYTINSIDSPDDINYAEWDFEYLPWDIWSEDSNYNNKMYITTWEKIHDELTNTNNVSTPIEADFSDYHILMFQANNGQSIKYFIDDIFMSEHLLSSKDNTVYPEMYMEICFSNWIWTGLENKGLGTSSDQRSYTMKVDWVYHAKNTTLNSKQAELLVEDFRQRNIHRYNSMDVNSIQKIANNYQYAIYPNPIKQGVHIQINEYKENSITIDLYDINGKKILSRHYTPNSKNFKVSMNLSKLAKGVYIIKIISLDEIQTTKVIKY